MKKTFSLFGFLVTIEVMREQPEPAAPTEPTGPTAHQRFITDRLKLGGTDSTLVLDVNVACAEWCKANDLPVREALTGLRKALLAAGAQVKAHHSGNLMYVGVSLQPLAPLVQAAGAAADAVDFQS